MNCLVVILVVAAAAMLLRPLCALSANRDIDRYLDEEVRELPMAAAVQIYKGAFVGRNPAGYIQPFVPGDEFVGIAYENIDNSSGAAGAETCRVYVKGDFSLTLASVALADVGRPAFATDDGTLALTGHPDAFVGMILSRPAANTALVRLRAPGQLPPNGVGSVELRLTGAESFIATGATAGQLNGPAGFEVKSALGLGVLPNDAEGGGVKFQFDATAEVGLASLRTINDTWPVDQGITFEAKLVVADKGDNAALDIDFGLGTALTANSEADIDHADMAQLACFHMDGNSDNILAQSDDATTDVAPVDTTIDNDSATDVPKRFKIIVRPSGSVEFWIDGARVLSSTAFAVLSTAVLAAFVNVEKTSDDTTAVLLLSDLRVAGGKA